LTIAKESNIKSENEIEAQTKELKGLINQKEKLVVEKSNLQVKIDKLLTIAKKGTDKAQLEFNSLMSQEKVLEKENLELKAKLEELKKAAAQAKAKEEADKAAAEAKAREEAEKAAAEAKAKEEAEKAAAEAKAKEEAEKAAAQAKAKEEADKAAAEAKAKEEAEKAAAEAKAKEEAEKADAEAKAKEEAEKAAAEAKAKEEAEKAAAEAKAKEEAEKAAAEAEAKEEADKAAEAKAKESEVKLMNAFSLTKVAFKTGSMQLTTDSKQRLDVAVNTMKMYKGYSYKVQGHTDSRGKEAFNLKLSTKRAEAVKAYLVSKGIDESVLSAEGFGSSQPISTNDTKKGREENRRVIFEIIQ
jgi:outer membrane protein OmpA-like peptidoglycan-associated protein